MNESNWIGPTKCDEYRKAREQDINNVWQELISSDGYAKAYTLLTEAIDLFRESISCFQNGAFMASVLMCRSATETALYCCATREVTKYFKDSGTVAAWDRIPLSNEGFGEILEKTKTKYNIDGRLEQVINEIRNKGNFVAHYGSRLDELYETHDITEITVKGSWITREQSLEVLRKSVFILKHLYEQIIKEDNLV